MGRAARASRLSTKSFADGVSDGRRPSGSASRSRTIATIGPATEFEVIGVVANQKYLDIREAAPRILYNGLVAELRRRA